MKSKNEPAGHEPADSDLSPLEPEPAPESTQRLAQAHGAGELRCALLALLLPKGSRRALASWQGETRSTPYATQIRSEAIALGAGARLPWFELLLGRMAAQPLVQRKGLLEATRRVVSARGTVRPLDTLHFLAMRRRLGEKAPVGSSPGSAAGFSKLPESDVHAIARFSAFLTRLVPAESPDGATGAGWYAAVMRRWDKRVAVPPQCPLPDTDAAVHALHQIAALPWMQRPVLLRDWVKAALAQPVDLSDPGADALRLAATLLDTPLPPELARRYSEPHP
jgi:hypothetical protein